MTNKYRYGNYGSSEISGAKVFDPRERSYSDNPGLIIMDMIGVENCNTELRKTLSKLVEFCDEIIEAHQDD